MKNPAANGRSFQGARPLANAQQVPGTRCRLGGDPLHVAVAEQGVDVVVEQRVTGPVVPGGQPRLGGGHADAGRCALPERAGGRLHPGRQRVFRMAGAVAVPGAEVPDVAQADCGLAQHLVVGVHRPDLGQVQRLRGMPVGQHELIAVGPDRDRSDRSAGTAATRSTSPAPTHRGTGTARSPVIPKITRGSATHPVSAMPSARPWLMLGNR